MLLDVLGGNAEPVAADASRRAAFVVGHGRTGRWACAVLALPWAWLVSHVEAQDPPDAESATPPVALELPPAEWPEGISAEAPVDVTVEVLVDREGHVADVVVARADALLSDRDILESRAIAYAYALRFQPALRGGVAIPARVRIRVRFQPPAPASEDEGDSTEADEEVGDVDLVDEDREPIHEFSARAEIDAPQEVAVSASEREIEVGALGRVPRRDAQSMLTLAPGILLSNHGGEGHAASMFLRGFDAEEGEDLEVLVEGIPINDVSNAHGHGYVDSSFLIPELVHALRVVQGPFDPAQGDFAVAGTAEYRLGLRERGIHTLASYGSYHDRRLTLLWGPEGEPSATFVGVSFRGGDGWGTNRAYGSASGLAQVELSLDRTWTLRLLAFVSTAHWRHAGALRLDDYQARTLPCAADEFSQFFCTYDSTQGGSAERAGGGVTLAWRSGSTRARLLVHGSGHALRVRENFTGFVGDPRSDGGPQRGDAVDQRYDAATLGARAELEHRFVLLEQVQHIHLGLVARHDETSTVQDRIRAELAVPYRSDFDRGIRVTHIGAFARLDATLLDWLVLSGGLRFDAFGFGVVDRNRATEDRIGERLPREATSAFGYLAQPRGTLRVRMLPTLEDAELDWVTSVGLGARSSDAAALSEGELAPFAEVLSLESGFSSRIGDASREAEGRGAFLEAGTSVFATRVSNDLVFDAARGRNSPTGPSTRVGWLAFARFRMDAWLDASASLTWTRGHLPPEGGDSFDPFAGPRLPFIPEWLFRLDAAARHSVEIGGERVEGSLALGGLFVGERPLPWDQFADAFFVLDAAVSVRWRWLEVGVSAENLLDVRYRQAELNYVSSFEPDRAPSLMAARHFVAGPPLRVMGRIAIRFEIGGGP